MTITSIRPDDICEVCGTKREDHGDKNHKFNSMERVDPRPVPKNIPPTAKGDAVSRDPLTALHLRLVEKLIAKNLLDGDDLLYIFGGPNAHN